MAEPMGWNPATYAKNARFVSDLAEPLLQLLDPRPGEAILDLGCGDGALTEKIAGFGCDVFGVDSSLAQTRAAKARGVRVAVMDGQRLYLKKSLLRQRGVDPVAIDPSVPRAQTNS